MHQFFQTFLEKLVNAGALEWIAVVAGIISVWFSKKEHILVYPVGLVNTIIFVYLSFKNELIGESIVNFYYTVVSIYGWIIWSKRNRQREVLLRITFSTRKQWRDQVVFFILLYLVFYVALTYLKEHFYEGAIPWADGFASATAFTGMWLMARKKVESWYWWILTNIASTPLYAVKNLALTSLYYLVLLVLAFYGLKEWKQKAIKGKKEGSFDA
jgi:nicotinamide mononucleotide transporter